jgi:hypothetical protein
MLVYWKTFDIDGPVLQGVELDGLRPPEAESKRGSAYVPYNFRANRVDSAAIWEGDRDGRPLHQASNAKYAPIGRRVALSG